MLLDVFSSKVYPTASVFSECYVSHHIQMSNTQYSFIIIIVTLKDTEVKSVHIVVK